MNSADGKPLPVGRAGRGSGRIGPDPDLWKRVLADCASGTAGRRKPKRRRSISPVRRVLIVAAVAACGYFLWRWLKPVDEREVIAGRLREIVEIVRKTPEEAFTVSVMKAGQLSKIAAPKVQVLAPEFHLEETMSRDEIISHFSMARKYAGSLDIAFTGMTVTLEGKDRASAKGTLEVRASGIGERFSDASDIIISWIRDDDDGLWHVAGVLVRPVIGHYKQ